MTKKKPESESESLGQSPTAAPAPAPAHEPTTADIEAAMEELLDAATVLDAAPVDRFLQLLLDWDVYEGTRIAAVERFNLRIELGIDRNQLAREYVFAKRAVLTVEARLRQLLEQLGQADRDTLLAGQRYVVERVGVSRIVSVRSELAKRLRQGQGA